jgi:hypothetical protein
MNALWPAMLVTDGCFSNISAAPDKPVRRGYAVRTQPSSCMWEMGRTKKILKVMEWGDDDLASGEGEKQELVGPPSQVHHCAKGKK